MEKKVNTSTNTGVLEKMRNAAIVATIALILSGCSTKEEKLQKQIAEVQRLEYALKQQSKNYHKVAEQQNIQQDLKNKGADLTINQEIGYSLEWATKQDKKIKKTKKKLGNAQKKVAKMKEKGYGITSTNSGKLNPKKYDYIPKEYGEQ